MELLSIFAIGFAFSFVGSIPPGTINLSVIQLSLQGSRKTALLFGLGAATVEYAQAVIAIQFEFLITSSKMIQDNFHVISASVMVLLGIINIRASAKKVRDPSKRQLSGFKKGMLISIANPLAIPFWIGITAFLEHENWITLDNRNLYIYVLGISLGTFGLLAVLAYLASMASSLTKQNRLVNLLPGLIFLGLGLYSFFEFFRGL